ncbi:hypothetical protein TrLO_g12086 [Triparma laevis f. longispina]|uniref:Uncharacterized protein n=1 Tax=Triparma laevis f. longispina TaxID=1714387 RepID=A0A9W7FNC2_9STRA|nr:hypothetical protein TrLO_g12086 [Triparma laevis f. longispina]
MSLAPSVPTLLLLLLLLLLLHFSRTFQFLPPISHKPSSPSLPPLHLKKPSSYIPSPPSLHTLSKLTHPSSQSLNLTLSVLPLIPKLNPKSNLIFHSKLKKLHPETLPEFCKSLNVDPNFLSQLDLINCLSLINTFLLSPSSKKLASFCRRSLKLLAQSIHKTLTPHEIKSITFNLPTSNPTSFYLNYTRDVLKFLPPVTAVNLGCDLGYVDCRILDRCEVEGDLKAEGDLRLLFNLVFGKFKVYNGPIKLLKKEYVNSMLSNLEGMSVFDEYKTRDILKILKILKSRSNYTSLKIGLLQTLLARNVEIDDCLRLLPILNFYSRGFEVNFDNIYETLESSNLDFNQTLKLLHNRIDSTSYLNVLSSNIPVLLTPPTKKIPEILNLLSRIPSNQFNGIFDVLSSRLILPGVEIEVEWMIGVVESAGRVGLRDDSVEETVYVKTVDVFVPLIVLQLEEIERLKINQEHVKELCFKVLNFEMEFTTVEAGNVIWGLAKIFNYHTARNVDREVLGVVDLMLDVVESGECSAQSVAVVLWGAERLERGERGRRVFERFTVESLGIENLVMGGEIEVEDVEEVEEVEEDEDEENV